jgi:hypothetical protein
MRPRAIEIRRDRDALREKMRLRRLRRLRSPGSDLPPAGHRNLRRPSLLNREGALGGTCRPEPLGDEIILDVFSDGQQRVSVRTSDEMGRGVYTRRPVLPGATLAEVGSEFVLDARRVLERYSSYLPDTADAGLIVADDPYVILCAFLYGLMYCSKCHLSRPEPKWVDNYRRVLLSDTSSSVLDWPRGDIDLLLGTGLHSFATEISSTGEKTIERTLLAFDLPGDEETKNRLRRCLSILLTRLVRLDDTSSGMNDSKVALVPGLDFFNMSASSTSFIRASKNGGASITNDVFLLSNQQAFINYGEKTSGEIYVLYGFYPENNPHDGCVVSVQLDSGPLMLTLRMDGSIGAHGGRTLGGEEYRPVIKSVLKDRIRSKLSDLKDTIATGTRDTDRRRLLLKHIEFERRVLSKTLMAL